MSPTMKEVAVKAGVSIATVSRVLSGSDTVNEPTRQRVLAAAEELQYMPSAMGRILSTRRTEAIGLLLPDIHGEYYSEIIRGADRTCQAGNHHLIVSSAHNSRDAIISALRMMRGRVDGLVVMSAHLDAETLVSNLPAPLPVVMLNNTTADHVASSISIDNVAGARDMVRHLVGHGHRRIALIRGSGGHHDAAERAQGYREALVEAGIAHEEELEFPGDFSESAGYEAAKKIAALPRRPTAIFASNDSMALGALSALRDAGVRVPEDVALAGFDDIPVARYFTPALTTVHTPISDLGMLAVTEVLDQLTWGNKNKSRTLLIADVVVRHSCGCNGRDAAL